MSNPRRRQQRVPEIEIINGPQFSLAAIHIGYLDDARRRQQMTFYISSPAGEQFAARCFPQISMGLRMLGIETTYTERNANDHDEFHSRNPDVLQSQLDIAHYHIRLSRPITPEQFEGMVQFIDRCQREINPSVSAYNNTLMNAALNAGGRFTADCGDQLNNLCQPQDMIRGYNRISNSNSNFFQQNPTASLAVLVVMAIAILWLIKKCFGLFPPEAAQPSNNFFHPDDEKKEAKEEKKSSQKLRKR
jgi:hypothetical protein